MCPANATLTVLLFKEALLVSAKAGQLFQILLFRLAIACSTV